MIGRLTSPQALKRLAAVITFFIAAIGAVTGVISFTRSIDIDVGVTVRHTAATARDPILEVGIVNNSQRAVSVVGGTVRFDGEEAGHVERFVPGPVSTEFRTQAERFAAASGLPFPLAAGQSFAGTVEWIPVDHTWSADPLPALERYLSRPRSDRDVPADRVRLELELDPGGARSKLVRLAIAERRASTVGHLPGWYTFLHLVARSGRVSALSLNTVNPGPGLAHLEVWGRGAKPTHAATRPIEASATTLFRLPRLRPGRYDWAVTVDGEPSAVGHFETPCGVQRDRDGEVHSEACRPD